MDKVIFAENCVYSTDCSLTGLNNNNIIVGTSGCGKTTSFTEPCMLETYERSLAVTVSKRRVVDKYKPLMAERGAIVWDLDFVHPERGNVGYDPLRQIKSYQDIKFLAEAIVKANPRKERSNADPYWDEAAISLLCAEIAYTLMTKENATFADVLQMHDNLDFKDNDGQIRTSYDEKFARIASANPTCYAVSCWKSFCKLPIRTASCIFGSLNTAIDSIFNSDLRKMMSMENQVDFEQLGKKKTVLFITTSPVNPAINHFINIFYSHLFKELFEFAEDRPDGKLPIPVHVIADDFAACGTTIPNFPEYVSIMREKNLSVSILLQSEFQLSDLYGGKATSIINNFDTYLYMGGTDLQTCRNISQRLNVPLDEVLYMPLKQVVLFRRGQRPIVTERYNITENELYRKITADYEKKIAEALR